MAGNGVERKRKPRTTTAAPDLLGNGGRPTLKTIAEMTGLAVTTVSRALAGAPQIALETRLRVAEVAQQIGYQPDRAALRLKTGRTHVISLILDPHEEILGYATSMISGLTEELRNTPYHLTITPHFSDIPQIEPVQYILRNRTADGIIFSRTEPLDERVKLLSQSGIPFICHGRTELATPHPYVDYDNFTFAYRAARTLIAAGCRKLAIILPPWQFTFAHHMRHGFMTAIREEGLAYEIPDTITIDSQSDEIRDCFYRRFGEADPPDGVICGGEVTALAVMAAAHDRNLALQKDVRIITKQTSGLFDQVRPRVETIYEDLSEAGRLMGELLLKQINGETSMTQLQHLQQVVER